MRALKGNIIEEGVDDNDDYDLNFNINITDKVSRGFYGGTPFLTSSPSLSQISSLTLSSERFTFSSTTEDLNIDCIDKAGSMFAEFKKGRPPTLREALESMDYGEKTEELLKIITEKATERLEELEAPGLSVEDVAVLFCYTYEWSSAKFGDGIDNPYRKVNKSISVERSNPALRKTRAFLFLLLQALRKLPRYTPANRVLYRGININIQTEVDPNDPDKKPYKIGKEKTWWTFTSTTEDPEVARYFVQMNKGTLFTLSGEAWGYDISIFSSFPDEKEVLLEPERRLRIKDIKKEGANIAVNADILDTPLVLKDYIEVKPVKVKDRKSKSKDAPRDLRVEEITDSAVTLSWDAPEASGRKVLSYQISVKLKQLRERMFKRSSEATYIAKRDETKYTVDDLEEGKMYEFRVRCKFNDGWGKTWSKWVNAKTKLKYMWKECPDVVDKDNKYVVDEDNPRIAKMADNGCCTIVGNTSIPLNTVTSWNVNVLKSRNKDGDSIYIGVAPFDINQNNDYNYNKCGWYLDCYYSTLSSGPPHNYRDKIYGPRKVTGEYVRTGDNVGVVMDTAKGELSFVLHGVNRGVAYEEVPLDKPIALCVIIGKQGDSVKFDISESKTNVDSSVPVPSNITTKSATWDSITLTWDEVKGASFYQIEVDGSVKKRKRIRANALTWKGLPPEKEYSFRVRTVRGSSVSEWSDAVKGRTQKETFGASRWKDCPAYVDKKRKYGVVNYNPRIALNIDDGYCTLIGNTPIPLNAVTTWNIKLHKLKDNDVYIGIAPSDISQNTDYNYNNCGWYFNCRDSTLCSGPPHNYEDKEYGPRGKEGEYVHTGDSVGVVAETTKGELSLILNKVNHGVAYEKIPLDKPLVPCVILFYQNDSAEIDITEVKETEVDSSVPALSNITAKSTWNTITLSWDENKDAPDYQIEVDGSKSLSSSKSNSFTVKDLLPDTEHNFRVRSARGSLVSDWSSVVKGRTLKVPVPTNISIKSNSLNAITITWDEIEDTPDYQIEVDGSKSLSSSKSNSFTVKDLLPDTERNFRVRSARGSSVSEWSSVVKGRTLKVPVPTNISIRSTWDTITLSWDENEDTSDYQIEVDGSKSLSSSQTNSFTIKDLLPDTERNFRVRAVRGSSMSDWSSVVKGRTLKVPVPTNISIKSNSLSTITLSWDENEDASDYQVEVDGSKSLSSSQTNSFTVKDLLPDTERNFRVRAVRGSSMSDWSSVVKGRTLKVPVPTNISIRRSTWDTITLSWDENEDTSDYQVEVDGSKSLESSQTNSFTIKDLLPDTEHNFRVRAMKKNSVSEWSDITRGRTPKAPEFSECVWKESPVYAGEGKKYNISMANPRIATNVKCNYCTIVGSTHVPPNKVTSWSIKVLVSKFNNGNGIYIGVAPFDINQKIPDGRGWYFYCYGSTLYSGPPHNYRNKEYGPGKRDGQYVHTGGSVGVVMDTTKGELSFVLSGVNHGVAYEGIPLDKPLVPCVLLYHENDLVELVIKKNDCNKYD